MHLPHAFTVLTKSQHIRGGAKLLLQGCFLHTLHSEAAFVEKAADDHRRRALQVSGILGEFSTVAVSGMLER